MEASENQDDLIMKQQRDIENEVSGPSKRFKLKCRQIEISVS